MPWLVHQLTEETLKPASTTITEVQAFLAGFSHSFISTALPKPSIESLRLLTLSSRRAIIHQGLHQQGGWLAALRI